MGLSFFYLKKKNGVIFTNERKQYYYNFFNSPPNITITFSFLYKNGVIFMGPANRCLQSTG